MGQTVNLLVYTFGGSNPSSPTPLSRGGCVKIGTSPSVAFQRAKPALRQHTARRVPAVLRICPHHICIWDVGTRRAESGTFKVCEELSVVVNHLAGFVAFGFNEY